MADEKKPILKRPLSASEISELKRFTKSVTGRGLRYSNDEADYRTAEAVAGRLRGRVFEIARSASNKGGLHESISKRDIAEAINSDGFDIERNQVTSVPRFDKLGIHAVIIELHPNLIVPVLINVVRRENKAEKREHSARRKNLQSDSISGDNAEMVKENKGEIREVYRRRSQAQLPSPDLPPDSRKNRAGKQLNMTVSADLIERLNEAAAATGVSRVAWIIEKLEEALDEQELKATQRRERKITNE